MPLPRTSTRRISATVVQDHLVTEFVAHYHPERPHQALGNAPPIVTGPPNTGEITCRERLGGLLKHYYRKAA
jgi:putative transposase